MLWLCLRFLHLPVELQAPDAGKLAITDRAGARRVIIAANEAARLAGIHVGMQAPHALLREPELRLVDRCKADERRALRALADWSLQFSSTVHTEPGRWLIWLEIGASLSYFEGLPALRSRIELGVSALHYSASIGIAPTLEAAALFALAANIPPATERDQIEPFAAALPLALLALDNKVIDQLRATGLTTIGEVLEIPTAALARRFGQEVVTYLRRLQGDHPDPRKLHRPSETYRRRYDFADPIQSVEGLLFPLRRLLQEFEGYLRGRDCAIQRLEITLRHRDSPESSFTLHTSAPMREALRLFALLREKLERTSWASPVTEVIVTAQEFLAPEVLQGDFFDDSQRQNAGWTALVDKLRARLGEQAIRRLGLRDDHRPEHAWCIQHDTSVTGTDEPFPERPLWLFEPTPIARPTKLLGRPERIEAGWWSGEDSHRDYYLAISPEGARWWLYKEVGKDQWYLHGLWA
ncbi:MAG: polymerase family protein [Gammaproteobacteria bacterium]|nr:polymerase family protein [Gammaproteobacteria bacterium]